MDLYEKLLKEERFFLISGPCVIEDRDVMMKTAETLMRESQKRNIPFIFKASFLKANRTSVNSFSGPGLDDGLKILQEIREQFSVPITTDVHESMHVKAVAEVVDIIQIPAFLCRQTFLISEAAKTGKIVNVKKGQFLAPEDMQNVAEKILAENNFNILLTERGSCFGYHNLVVDFRSFPAMKSIGYPIVYDATHSLQRPSIKNVSGGDPEYVEMMVKAALATGMVDGIFLETHPQPMEALSDAMSMIPLEQVSQLLDNALRIVENCDKENSLDVEYKRFE